MKILQVLLLTFGLSLNTQARNLCEDSGFSEQFKVFCSLIDGEMSNESIQLIKSAKTSDPNSDWQDSSKGLGPTFTSYLNGRLSTLLSEEVRAMISFKGHFAEDYISPDLANVFSATPIADTTLFVIEAPLSTLLLLSNDPNLIVMAPDVPIGPNPAVTIKN